MAYNYKGYSLIPEFLKEINNIGSREIIQVSRWLIGKNYPRSSHDDPNTPPRQHTHDHPVHNGHHLAPLQRQVGVEHAPARAREREEARGAAELELLLLQPAVEAGVVEGVGARQQHVWLLTEGLLQAGL